MPWLASRLYIDTSNSLWRTFELYKHTINILKENFTIRNTRRIVLDPRPNVNVKIVELVYMEHICFIQI